ncbi:MAG: hypothetical protein AAB474_01285 [Patescibacteria group bacterium]
MNKEQPDLFPRKNHPEQQEDETGHEPTPEEQVLILKMQGEKNVKKVITEKDRRTEKEKAKKSLDRLRQKLKKETKEGQKEMFE